MTSLRMAAAGAALATALVAAPAAVRAQGSVLVGTVISDSSDAPVVGAEVAVAALRRAARAGDDGAFSLRGLPAGTHVVTVGRPGFEPVSARVSVTGAGDTVAVDFALGRRAATLARADTAAAAPGRTASADPMVEARARVRKSGGVFIGREALAASGRTAMSDVLRRVPGVGIQHIATSGGTIAVLASSRGGAAQSALTPGVKYCPYQIFIDGARVYVSGEGEPPEIDTFVPSDYQGIEVYRGSAQTPPRYAGTGAVCGTVVFWSRAK